MSFKIRLITQLKLQIFHKQSACRSFPPPPLPQPQIFQRRSLNTRLSPASCSFGTTNMNIRLRHCRHYSMNRVSMVTEQLRSFSSRLWRILNRKGKKKAHPLDYMHIFKSKHSISDPNSNIQIQNIYLMLFMNFVVGGALRCHPPTPASPSTQTSFP